MLADSPDDPPELENQAASAASRDPLMRAHMSRSISQLYEDLSRRRCVLLNPEHKHLRVECAREMTEGWPDEWRNRSTDIGRDYARFVEIVVSDAELWILRGDPEQEILNAAKLLPSNATIRPEMFPCKDGMLMFAKERPSIFRTPINGEVFWGLLWTVFEDPKLGKTVANVWGMAEQSHEDGHPRMVAHPPTFVRWKMGSPWSDLNDTHDEFETLTCSRILATMLFFIEQRLVSFSRGNLDRATARRCVKAGMPDPQFTVIQLRAVDRKRNDEEEIGRHLTARHLRRGAWHNHYFPSDGSHRPTWHRSTIVGHPSLPLKPFAGRVFDVHR